MRIKLFALFGLLSLCSIPASAQWCGTHDIDENHIDQAFESHYQYDVATKYGATSKRDHPYVIPVVFHVIHQNGDENVSYEELQGLIEATNENLAARNKDTASIQPEFKGLQADCEIELRMAKKDVQGNCTNGVTRHYSDLTHDAYQNVKSIERWNTSKYLNIWVVKSILTPGTPDDGTTTLGYAQFPGGSSQTDGIVIRSDRMGGRTLTHELGHYLNLYHTFQWGCGRSSCLTSGDRVCDTPPTAENNFGCPKGRNSCFNDIPNQIDQIENHMDYSNCRSMFTEGQKVRMHSALDFYRPDLVSDANLRETGTDGSEVVVAPIASFYSDVFRICEGGSITFINESCNYSGSFDFKWEVSGPETYESTEEKPTITFNKAGLYDVKLTVTNPQGSDSKTLADYISVGTLESDLKAPYTHGFNSLDRLPYNWSFETDESGLKWQLRQENGYNETNCLYINNIQNSVEAAQASFIMPGVDISASEDQFLRYRVAYARINENSADILQTSVSIDCGASWRLVQSDVSTRLMTTSDKTSTFIPQENADWKEMEIDLSRYDRFQNLMIKFTFISGNGNNIYMDDIRVGSTELSINDAQQISINVFPNPANELINYHIPEYAAITSLNLVDLSGKMIYTIGQADLSNGQLDVSGLKPGFYQLVASGNKGRIVTRVIIE